MIRSASDESTRTLALGSPGSAFYGSFRHVLHHFGEVEFASEHELDDVGDVLSLVRRGRHDQVLMPNPYGNPRRLACYRALREAGVRVIASDRGALPRSWFFDHGFNYDSPSYQPEAWDHPLGADESARVASYIEELRASNAALETQGPRGGNDLRARLGLANDTRILFVPLQRPFDTVVRYFSGAVDSLDGLVELVSNLEKRLETAEPGRWRILLKKHPLEKMRLRPSNPRVRYVPDGTHIHDLLDAADATLVLNSGVGLLSLCFGKPTLHVGDAFYGHPGLAERVSTAEEAEAVLARSTPPDEEKVRRFVHHLIDDVYSFADFETEVRATKDGDTQRITRHMEFSELRILGESFPVGGDRVVVVSPVIPSGIYRGSQSRVDMVIRALVADGKRVSLAVLNTSFGGRSSKDIVRELRDVYPWLERIEVRRHPKFDKSAKGRAKWAAIKAADIATAGRHRIAGLESCPPVFRRCVKQLCHVVKPHFLLVNYAKLGPVVPDDFDGISVIDTHDYQTQFLIEDQEANGIRRDINRHVYRFSEHRELAKFDRLIAINPDEKKTFESIFPSKPVHFIPAFAEASGHEGADLFWSFEYDALLVASMSNFNVTGLKWFAEKVLPTIVARKPDFRLAVAGNIIRAKGIDPKRWPSIRFLGIVPDLSGSYEATACVIAPILGGAGMKIKVVEALAHGKAIVATPKALDGIRAEDGKHLLVAEDPAAFAEAVLSTLEDDARRRQLEAGARELHRRDHSPASIAESLQEAFAR